MFNGRFSPGIAVVAAFFLAGLTPSHAAASELVVGTGSKSGVYYQAGRALCRILNAARDNGDPACRAESTAGSLYNLKNVRAGNLDLGVVQSDWQYHAFNGSSRFAEAGPDEDLRSLFSLHGEPFTVVAREDSGIKGFDDLKGKRVNIGNPGSGQRGTMEVLMDAIGWTKEDFALANELPASQQSLALCHDRVQAIVYTVGHPNPSIGQATGLCRARVIPVKGKAVDKLVDKYPFYAVTEIPGGIYSGNDEPVVTFGVTATVVISAKTDEATAYRIVFELFENLESFKKMHPAFGSLDPAKMIRDGLSAPLHEGALRYYREKRWF